LPSSSLPGVCSLILFPLFAAGVVDTGGNLPPASLTPAANLPPVSLTPVANLPPVSTTQGAWGKVILEKNEAKNLVTLSL
jgi:hypothetical protein